MREKNDPGKISAKSDNWFKSYGQKVGKKAHFWNRVPGTNYPVPGYPDFANYPVLVTRFLTSLIRTDPSFSPVFGLPLIAPAFSYEIICFFTTTPADKQD